MSALPYLFMCFMEFVHLLVFKIKTKSNDKFQGAEFASVFKIKRKVKIYSFEPDM
jgi:hypothetical protein